METWYNKTFFNCLPDQTLRGNDEVRKLETEILTVSKTDWNEKWSVIWASIYYWIVLSKSEIRDRMENIVLHWKHSVTKWYLEKRR